MQQNSGTPDARFYSHQRYQLLVAILVVIAALVLTPASPHGERVSLLGWEIPALCPHQLLFHVKCPGCGLIRSFTALAHGRLNESIAFHRFGILLFAAVLLQIPLRLHLLRAGPAGLTPTVITILHWSGPVLIFGLVMSWAGGEFDWS